MAEYDFEFGERLAETARMVLAEGIVGLDGQRTVLYLSLLSTEITLKAMLERAGKPVTEIRARSHQLPKLLSDLCKCEVEVEIATGIKRYMAASRIRAIQINHGIAQTTLGAVIDAQNHGASTYPNQVRYGEVLLHFPVDVVAQMASEVSLFAREHWHSIRIK